MVESAHKSATRGKYAKTYRRYYLQRHYGISLEEYDRLLTQQNGGCAICHEGKPRRRHAVDHNHKTGKVRGLLCGSCNRALGYFKDSPELLASAITYLKGAE